MPVDIPMDDNVPIHSHSNPTAEFGVAVAEITSSGETFMFGTASHHMIGVISSLPVWVDHVIDGQRLRHEAGTGALCLCPAGAEYVTTFDSSMSGLILQVSPECLALAKADLRLDRAQMVEKTNGKDGFLAHLAHVLHAEATSGHPNGMLFWNCASTALIMHLVRNHLSAGADPIRGPLDLNAILQVKDYINDNLDSELDLDDLAGVAGCNRFKFARLFHSAVGMSPHRYVIRRRLESARSMFTAGSMSLAEIAFANGFTDQSHMTRWIRRVYGTTPAQLGGGRHRARGKNFRDADRG